jgi:transposase
MGGIEGLNTVSALTHREILALLERKVVQPGLFDEREVAEVLDPDDPRQRYCLCRNPHTAESETATRRRLVTLTEEGLREIAAYKRKATVEVLGARVGKLLAKYKVAKFFDWHVEADPAQKSSRAHKVAWSLKQEAIAEEQMLDGCYVVRTDVEAARLDKDEVVASYKSLANVERAFRSLKMSHLEIRPVYHKKDERIRAHVFMCTLAYYLQWHMVQRLRPLFEADGEGKERRWTVQNVVERLRQICRSEVELGGVRFHKTTLPDEEQKQILELLDVTM